jgi:hypothetical protein
MTNAITKTLNSSNRPEQEIGLADAYSQSASQDKLINAGFEAALEDGIVDEQTLVRLIDVNATGY